jgi:transposase
MWYCADNLYLKRVTTRKAGRTYTYLKLVHAFRDGDRVRQRVVANLGPEEELKASGQLEQLAAAFARRDPPMFGVRREVGPLLLVKHYLERLGLAQIVDRQLPSHGRAQLTNAEVVSALIANRLAAPSPLYDISGWASSAAVQEIFGIPAMLLNDDRLGRGLEAFCPQAETIRGATALAAIERFGLEAGRLHLDLTSLRVAGAYEGSSLVAKGWDHQRQTVRQVKVLEATTPSGIPLYVRPHPGNAAELSAVASGLERLAALMPPGLVFCADSAFGHLGQLCLADRAGLGFVVPLRDPSRFRELYREQVGASALQHIDYQPRRERDLPFERRTHYRGCLRRLPVVDPRTGDQHLFKVAFIWSSEEEKTVTSARQRALDKAEEELTRVQRGLGSHYRSVQQVSARVAVILSGKARDLLQVEVGEANGRPTLSWQPDLAAIAEQAATDGIYALASNLRDELTAGELLRIYKEQSLVELRHRDLKHNLRVRPIFLHNDDRIQALVSIVGLALLVFGLIELDLRRALGPEDELSGLLPEARSGRPTGRNILAAFQGLGLTYTPKGIRLDRLTSTQRRILQLLQVSSPWTENAA